MDARFLDALTAADQDPDRAVIHPLSPWVQASLNQPLLFVKPEITGLGSGAAAALQLIEQSLEQWNCVVDSLLLLGPDYLKRHGLIEQHYGIINRYSERGVQALDQTALALANDVAAEHKIPVGNILGAHEFLRSRPDVTPSELLSWHENTRKLTKLSSGAYCSIVENEGQLYGVINGFHPAQLEHFYSSGAPILVATLQTTTRWAALRGFMIGATNPSLARAGSLRNELFTRASELGMADVSGMRNGVHLSAGPLEAAAEILRYLSDHSPNSPSIAPRGTNIGALLCDRIGEAHTTHLLNNEWSGGVVKTSSPYDLTEEVDTQEALNLLTPNPDD